MKDYLLKKFWGGVLFSLGIASTAVMAVAVTGTITSFNSGEKVSSSKINENFLSLKSAIESIPEWTKSGTDAVFSGGNISVGTATAVSGTRVTVNGRISSSVLGVYCGNTSGIGTSGSFTNGSTAGAISYNGKTGYRGAKAACETACTNVNAHMCTSHEIAISRQLGVSIDPTEQLISIGGFAHDGTYYATDCDGWTSNSSSKISIVTNHINGTYWSMGCNALKLLTCCL